MAIRMMVGREHAAEPNVETVRDYPGHEEGLIRHGTACPHRTTTATRGNEEIRLAGLYDDCVREGGYDERCSGPFEPLYMRTSHVGLVLETREYNGYDDSDFYAIVWNPETKSTERVDYATTRGWTYPNSASVDATPEVRADYEAMLARKREEARKLAEEREARTPAPGKALRVVRGRKVPIGTTGVCVWYGEGKRFGFDYAAKYSGGLVSNRPMRVGLKTPAGVVHWTDAKNVEVV